VIIAALQRRRGGRRIDVLFDIELTLSIGVRLAQERGLRTGLSLTQRDLAELQQEDERRIAFDSAMRLLAYRQRSERELRDRLRRTSLPRHAIDHAVARLRDLGYVNDDTFARTWTQSQQAARPRARWLLARELTHKGVASETAAAATDDLDVDDEDAAYQAASRRARTLRRLDYTKFRERLGAFLTRRGFSYDIARRTIDRCWSEFHDLAADPATQP
jgi:regulatory protein